jgi:hypothetical protein
MLEGQNEHAITLKTLLFLQIKDILSFICTMNNYKLTNREPFWELCNMQTRMQFTVLRKYISVSGTECI